jgi:hypothetical protein
MQPIPELGLIRCEYLLYSVATSEDRSSLMEKPKAMRIQNNEARLPANM